jgi:hypothetical protein
LSLLFKLLLRCFSTFKVWISCYVLRTEINRSLLLGLLLILFRFIRNHKYLWRFVIFSICCVPVFEQPTGAKAFQRVNPAEVRSITLIMSLFWDLFV